MPYKKPDPLTPMQRKFVECYLREGNAKKAVRSAGYSLSEENGGSDVAKQGRELLRNPKIIKELEKARKKSEARAAYNYEMAMEECKLGMDLAEKTENASAFVGAVKIRSQLTGLLVEKVQVQAGFQIRISGIDDGPERIVGQVPDINLLTGEKEDE